MRMILMQMAFGALAKAGRVTKRAKVIVIIFICACLVARDLANFFKERTTTIYEQIGVDRQSTIFQFEEAFDQYKLCIEYDDECKDTAMTSPIYQFNSTQIEEIRYVVSDPALKELYDKTEMFIRKKGRTKYTPTEGARYISAFKELSSYAGYVFFMFILVEQH